MNKRLMLAIIALGLLASSCTSNQDTPRSADTTSVDIAAQRRDSVVITLTAVDSTTVFELLKSEHQVDYQSSSIGVFVKGIDSIYNTTNAFWIYSVNDTMPKIAADKFRTRPGDIVQWRLHFSKP